ncbi:hypothetical protein BaRGS_00016464 [Batillaria attramentaria]|uniref:Uncharacterized protein n=1 Tax=Batillaria attramentaria TaxID=370345 RepID=A0ABD0KYX5_9CAEN
MSLTRGLHMNMYTQAEAVVAPTRHDVLTNVRIFFSLTETLCASVSVNYAVQDKKTCLSFALYECQMVFDQSKFSLSTMQDNCCTRMQPAN